MVVVALVAAAVGCTASEPALVRHYERRADALVVRATVIACDAGRRVVVRRTRLVNPWGRPRSYGRTVTAVSGVGGDVAWGELRIGRRRLRAHVTVSRVRAGRVVLLHDRIVLRRSARTGRPQLEVALSSHGDVAWRADTNVLVARPGRRPRLLTRRAEEELALEDDRTLRWRFGESFLGFADLRPWPGGGCPVRSHFAFAGKSADVVVTEAEYPGNVTDITVLRACERATGEDPIVVQASLNDNYGVQLAGVSGPWLVLHKVWADRAGGCFVERVMALHALTRRRGRVAEDFDCDPSRLPKPGEPAVASEGGVPAWLVRDATRSAVLTAAADKTIIILDSAGPSGITGLVADGRAVRWLHDGEPRSADLG